MLCRAHQRSRVEIRTQGRDVDDSSLFFLHGGEEFMFHMPMGIELLSITFEREMFERRLDKPRSAKALNQLLASR